MWLITLTQPDQVLSYVAAVSGFVYMYMLPYLMTIALHRQEASSSSCYKPNPPNPNINVSIELRLSHVNLSVSLGRLV